MPICGRLDPKYDYILVTLLSNHSGIIWQREDNVLKWTFFFFNQQTKKLKTYFKKGSGLVWWRTPLILALGR